ncbi:MAG: 1-acyl-sn-glycerol-3-phosphate acyltransferase [Acidimicrobiales bacterium]
MSFRVPPRAARRALLPLVMAVELALGTVFAVVAAACCLAWPLAPRRRAARVAAFGALYMTVETATLLACGWYWLRAAVRRRRHPGWWIDAHNALLHWDLTVLIGASRVLFGFRMELIEPAGADLLGSDRPVLVLARHGGPGDSFALVEMLLGRYRRRPRVVVKELLALDPALDVILSRLGCLFVRRGEREATAAAISTIASCLEGRDAMLLFPEGGNWTPNRRDRAIEQLRQRGDVRGAQVAGQLEHLLPPRPTGVLSCVAGRPGIDVVCVVHTGLEALVTPAQVWAHIPFELPMTVSWWPAGARPPHPGREGGEEWLFGEWMVMDAWIGARAGGDSRPEPAGERQPDLAGD